MGLRPGSEVRMKEHMVDQSKCDKLPARQCTWKVKTKCQHKRILKEHMFENHKNESSVTQSLGKMTIMSSRLRWTTRERKDNE